MYEIAVNVKMSFDKRQHARTQGKYQYQTESNGKQKKSGGGKQANKSPDSVEKKEILWCEDSNDHHFPQLDVSSQAKIISEPGHHILSTTKNGESRIYFEPGFMTEDKAYMHFRTLRRSVDWCKKKIVVHGQEYRQPRLVAWFGPLPYEYSGVTLTPKEFPEAILKIKKEVEAALKKQNIHVELNSVLLNLYRNCKDSVAWHSDDESSMGIHPTIASVSLGETRRFEMRRRNSEQRPDSKAEPELVVFLNNGSLIVMDGVMQQDWLHRVPKEYHDRDERINLTFRTVFPIESVPHPLSSRGEDYFDKMPKEEPQVVQETFQYDDEQFPSLGAPDSPQPKPQRNWSDYFEHQDLHNSDSAAPSTRRKSLETSVYHQNSGCDEKLLCRKNSGPIDFKQKYNENSDGFIDFQNHDKEGIPCSFVPPFVPKQENVANYTSDCVSNLKDNDNGGWVGEMPVFVSKKENVNPTSDSDLHAYNGGQGVCLSNFLGNAYNGECCDEIPPPVPKRENEATKVNHQSDSLSNLQNNAYNAVWDDSMNSATDNQTELMESEDCNSNPVSSRLNADVPEFIPRQHQTEPYSSHAYKNSAGHKYGKTHYTDHRKSGQSSAQHKTSNYTKSRSYNQNFHQNHNNGEYSTYTNHKSDRKNSDRASSHKSNIQNFDKDKGYNSNLNDQKNFEQNSSHNPKIQNSSKDMSYSKHHGRNFEQNSNRNPIDQSSPNDIGYPRFRGGGNQTHVSHAPQQNVRTQVYRNSSYWSNPRQQTPFASENAKQITVEQNFCPSSRTSSDAGKSEEDPEYAAEGKKLANIYGYVVESRKDIPFSSRDLDELDTLIAIVDESGPMKVNVMKIISKRMATLVELAENRELQSRRGRPHYSKHEVPPRYRKEQNFNSNYR